MEHRLAARPYHLGLRKTTACLLPYLQEELSCCLALPPGTRPYCSFAPSLRPRRASPCCLALPPGTQPNCIFAPPLSPKSISSLVDPPTWDSAKLQLGSSLTSKEHRLAAWPFHMGLGHTADWDLPYFQGASSYCLALQPGTRPYCRLAPPLPLRSIASLLRPPTWDSTKLQLCSSLICKEHRLAAWPSHLGLGQTTAWLLPYLQGSSPCCLDLPHGTRPNYSLAHPLPPRSIASLLGPPTWNSSKLQLGLFFTSKEHRLAAWPSHRGFDRTAACFSLTSKKHRLAAWPSHLGLGQTTAWLLPYLQGASPRCLALPHGTQPYYSLAPPLPPRSIALILGLQPGLAQQPGTQKNYSLAPPSAPRSIALLLGPPTWDSAILQPGSFLTSKEHRLTAWPSNLALDPTAGWFLPYLQGASPHCFALPPGTRSNYSLDPSLPPRSIASLLGPPTWDSAKLQLASSLVSKKHRLAAWPSHLVLGQTVSWLLPGLQVESYCGLALPPGTRKNYSLAPPLPPRSIALLLGPPTWDSDILKLGSSLTSKEHRLTASPFRLGLGQTTAWLLPYVQGALPRYLAPPPGTKPNCCLAPPMSPKTLPTGTKPNCCLAPPLSPKSIASLLAPPTWDSVKLQLGSSLTSKKQRLSASPFYLGLGQTTAWLLPYVQGALPRCLALPPGTRPNCSLAPSLPPRSIASLLGPPTWDSTKLLLGSSLTTKEHQLAARPSHLRLGQMIAWPLPYVQGASPRCLALPPGIRSNYSSAAPLPPRSIVSMLGPTTWDSVKLQLGTSLTSKEHRLTVSPSHLGLGQTAVWLLPYVQGA
ncbi:hypothetical protein Adt_35075 [Abeliophyllum distichum]|uniref:Uncharacterized protein n=1 Tax=Abeliophyllum distichum TaxID=126358 RepID=A0ABD1QH43_9LAMI